VSANDLTAQIEYMEHPWLPGYRAHRDGFAESNVYTGQWRRLNPVVRKNGHYRFDVYLEGKRISIALHNFICEAWHGARPSGTECLFQDGDNGNLHESNLSWGIASKNTLDPSIEYRSIPECDGYKFGSDGSIWTCWRTNLAEKTDVWRKLGPRPSASGHLKTSIKINGEQKTVGVHHMICWAFHGACPEGMECCHGPDRSPANNVPENLRWDTSQENIQDQIRHGTKARGERCGPAKLTDEKVREIRKLSHLGPRKLGRMFGVTHGVVGKILRGEAWTHVA
jgi:HNH endonuclease